jgi:hypothetical protein
MLKAEQDRKQAEEERQRIAMLKAEQDRKQAEEERRRIALLQQQERERKQAEADVYTRKRDHDDCDRRSTPATADQNIAACSRIINDPTESLLSKARAYSNRCSEWSTKQDYTRAERDCSEAIRLDPTNAGAGRTPTRRTSTAPSPTSTRRSGSIRVLPGTTTTGGGRTPSGRTSTAPWPTSARRSGSIRALPGPTTTGGTCTTTRRTSSGCLSEACTTLLRFAHQFSQDAA